MDAARLLLADDPAEAADLAERLEAANLARRDLTARPSPRRARRVAVLRRDAPATSSTGRGRSASSASSPAAGRRAGRPAVVGAELGEIVRGSCRSDRGSTWRRPSTACADLLLRHGGHAGAAGFELPA